MTLMREKTRLEYVGTITDVSSKEAQAIKKIMIECDDDFVPPLSVRQDTTAEMEKQELHEDNRDIQPYFEIVLGQKNLAAYYEDEIVGFMSFRHNEKRNHLKLIAAHDDIVNYVSTICVLKDYRGCGITSGFYNIMGNAGGLPNDVTGTCVATRTWNSNNSHIGLLKKRKYTLTETLEKDRNFNGNVYDTVYYCKKISN